MPVNFAASQVVTAPSPATSGTTLTVVPGDGANFPSTPFNALVTDSSNVLRSVDSSSEIVRVTGISTDTLTITRAQESTSARTVVVGDRVYAGITDGVTTRYLPYLGTNSVTLTFPTGSAGSLVAGGTSSWVAARALILSEATITGIIYVVGGTAVGSVRAALYNSGGARVANRTGALAQGSSDSTQLVAFDSPYSADPGLYYTLLWMSATNTSFYGANAVAFLEAGNTAGATPTTVSPALTQTQIPMMMTY